MLTGEPFIPETITVHLGRPDANVQNVTVSFTQYVKNVASSEIYPTWPENSLRANIYVIITFTLNRIYTEWYRSRGYNFDITSSTQYDQKFINGREIFENVGFLVDELFNSYVRRQGYVEPYFTSFCNGTTALCDGLSQWGTVDLARQGFTPYEILQYYYGDNIDIVKNAPVQSVTPSYPNAPLKEGDNNNGVRTIQIQLNRISRNYPAIPKISEVDGIYGVCTTSSVKTFQSIFNLQVTGIVDEATWYKISYIYTSVKNLAELGTEGLTLYDISKQFESDLRIGMQGNAVRALQYYLAVIGAYYNAVSPVPITGYFGEQTELSVKSFQRVYGIPQTGVVDNNTWNDIYRAYAGIFESIPFETAEVVLYPGTVLKEGANNEYVKIMQEYLTFISKYYSEIPAVNNTGYFGPITKQSVIDFETLFGLTPNGIIGADTWNEISRVYSELKYGFDKRPYQFPGYTID